jgi:ABC-type nitrate/sulfonate/bicarbonate transport system substrate-binding protein
VRKGISGLIAPCLWFCLCGLALLPVAARAATPLSVQLNWKHQFEFAAFYAAQEHGYYRDAGLEVTIREGGPGVDAVKEVVEGRADFGVGTSELVVERYRGKSVVARAVP